MKPEPLKPDDGLPRRILIVDDHPLMRAGLKQLITRNPDLIVSGEAGSPTEAFTELARELPDLMLADMSMPGRSGFEFIKDVLALYPQLQILILSMHDEGLYAERVLRAGARGYLMKDAGGERLTMAIRQVLAGNVSVSPVIAARLLEGIAGKRPRGSSSPIETLSDREFEIFQLIGMGRKTKEIADQLHLSPKTVDAHRSNIRDKLHLVDSVALVRFAIRWVDAENGAVG